MFSIQQIEKEHEKVKSGADFPKYIQALKQMGVQSFQTLVKDSSTTYLGTNNNTLTSEPQYDSLFIADEVATDTFKTKLREHQQGKTDYFTFCSDCAVSGIEKWVMDLEKMTCVYYDKTGNDILTEQIPEV